MICNQPTAIYCTIKVYHIILNLYYIILNFLQIYKILEKCLNR